MPCYTHEDVRQPHCDVLCLPLNHGDHSQLAYDGLALGLSDKQVWGLGYKLVLGLSSTVVLVLGYKLVFGESCRLALGEDGKLVPVQVYGDGLVLVLCDRPVLGRGDRRLEQDGGRGQVVGGHYRQWTHDGGLHGVYIHMRGVLYFHKLARGWYGADMMGFWGEGMLEKQEVLLYLTCTNYEACLNGGFL